MPSIGFLSFFCIFIGLLLAAVGGGVLFFGMGGVGPCGSSCSFHQALWNVLGQRSYSLVYGLITLLIGLSFMLLPFFSIGVRTRSKSKKSRLKARKLMRKD